MARGWDDPTVVARYFVKCIIEMGGTACIVRADCGTENSHVAAIQRFLRIQITHFGQRRVLFMAGLYPIKG